MSTAICPCGSGNLLEACCGHYHDGHPAPCAEALMRSRYSAYCHHNNNTQCYDYILQTYHSKARSEHSLTDIADFAKAVRFIGLKIINDTSLTSKQVHFVASYLVGDKLELLDEVSDFELEQGKWMYCSGVLTEHATVKLSRNDTCPCGSGLKFKKCQHQLQACS